MTEKTLEEIQGCEYDWLVCDKAGHIALFSTAGEGYAPREFLLSVEDYDQAIESFLNLAVTTTAKVFPKIAEGLPNTWKQVAERGMYGYDLDFTDGSYQLVSIPENPIFIDDLPLDIAVIIRRVQLGSILFNEKRSIFKSDIVENEVN